MVEPLAGIGTEKLIFGGLGSMLEALGTWILVIAGWIVVNDQNRFQEIIRANHQRFDTLRSLLDDVEKSALELHIGAYDEAKSRRIRRLLKKVAIDCKLLAECGALDDAWTERMISLRQAVTLQNFDKSDFKPQAVGSPILGAIESAKDGFESYIASRTSAGLREGRSLWASLRSVFRRTSS